MLFIDTSNISFESIITDELYSDIIMREYITIVASEIISSYKLNDSHFVDNITKMFEKTIAKCNKYKNYLIKVQKNILNDYKNDSCSDYYIDIISTKTFYIDS